MQWKSELRNEASGVIKIKPLDTLILKQNDFLVITRRVKKAQPQPSKLKLKCFDKIEKKFNRYLLFYSFAF